MKDVYEPDTCQILPALTTSADLAAYQTAVTVLDVRSPVEFSSAHIPGSYNVPLDLLHYNQSMTCDGSLVIANLGSRRLSESVSARPSRSSFPLQGDDPQ